MADTIVELAGATVETRFVRPGIGMGRIALPLLRRGHRYVGVDIFEKMLTELERKLAAGGWEGAHGLLQLFRADATALPFGDDSFNAAVSAHVLHLIPAWRRALAEVRRMLKPGGVFLYCHQEWDETGLRAAFSERWREILASHGVDALAPGASCARRTLSWRPMSPPASGKLARSRMPSTATLGRLCRTEWRLPVALFEVALGELRSWVVDRYTSPKTVLNDAVTLEVTAVRGWADGRFEA